MKILMVGPGMGIDIPPNGHGGIEKVVWKHAVELRKRGHEVIIVNKQDKNELLEVICRLSPEIIHVHQEWCHAFLREQDIPFIFTSHMSSWQRNWHLVKPLLEGCTMAMPFEQMADKMRYEPRCPTYRHWPIWNGADKILFKPGIKIKGRALAVGKNEPRKKFGEVIKYVQDHPEMHLMIVSPDVETLQGDARINLVPNQPEPVVASFMGQAEYFFHLADEEADCLVVKEAAMAGCNLVLSKYCCETFMWKDQVSEYISGPITIPGEMAWKIAKSHYTWERVVENVENGYRHYLNRENR